MMNGVAMRRAISDNPQWGVLDVIRECFGVEPNVDQVRNAVDDPQTIAGIPSQFERWQRLWSEAYPAISMGPEDIGPHINVTRYGTTHYRFTKTHVLKALLPMSVPSRTWAANAKFFPVHPVVSTFRKVTGHDPSAEALAHYMADWDELDYSQSRLEAAIRAGMKGAKT